MIEDAYRIQSAVLIALLALYVHLTFLHLADLFAAAAGPALYGAAVALGRRTRGSELGSMEPMVVAMAAIMTLLLFSVWARFPMTSTSFTLIAIGAFAVLGGWAVNRLPAHEPLTRRSIGRAVGWATLHGVGMAIAAGAIATVVYVIGAISGEEGMTMRNLGVLLAAYLVGGIIAGVIVGLLQPFSRWPLGLMLIGIPVATVVYGAVGLSMMITDDPGGPENVRQSILMAIGIGTVAGPMAALAWRGTHETLPGRI